MIILMQNSVSIEIYITFKLILRFISLIHQLIPWNLNQAHCTWTEKHCCLTIHAHRGMGMTQQNGYDPLPLEWVKMRKNLRFLTISFWLFLTQLTSSPQKFSPDTNVFDIYLVFEKKVTQTLKLWRLGSTYMKCILDLTWRNWIWKILI